MSNEPQRPGPAGGVRYPITETWRAEVRAGLERMHWNQSDLARAISTDADKTTPAAISYVMNKAGGSTLVPRINAVLGIQANGAAVAGMDGSAGQLLSTFSELNESNRAALIRLARHMLVDQQCDEAEGP